MELHRSSCPPEYDNPAFWDSRYKSSPEAFEWYQGYASLKRILKAIIPLDTNVLQIGVGTSNLQADMADDGYLAIANIDVSQACIDVLRERHKGRPALQYLLADCRSMPQFPDESFEAVLDKGTLDAILCGDAAFVNAQQAMKEIHRVLRLEGVFVCITYGPPGTRIKLFELPSSPFRVLVYATQKPDAQTGSQNCRYLGPFHASDPVQREKLCQMNASFDELHWVYLCIKLSE